MIIVFVIYVRVFVLNFVYGIDYKVFDIWFRSVCVEFFDIVFVFIVVLWIYDVVNIDYKFVILVWFIGIWYRL